MGRGRREGRREKKGYKKELQCYVHVTIPHKECKNCVLQMCTDKKKMSYLQKYLTYFKVVIHIKL